MTPMVWLLAPLSLGSAGGGEIGLGSQYANVTTAPQVATSSPAMAAAEPFVFDFLPRKDPTTAMLLSLAITGAGQFYNGESSKGWLLLASWALYPIAWALDATLESGYFRTGALAFLLIVKGYSVWDANSVAAAKRGT